MLNTFQGVINLKVTQRLLRRLTLSVEIQDFNGWKGKESDFRCGKVLKYVSAKERHSKRTGFVYTWLLA